MLKQDLNTLSNLIQFVNNSIENEKDILSLAIKTSNLEQIDRSIDLLISIRKAMVNMKVRDEPNKYNKLLAEKRMLERDLESINKKIEILEKGGSWYKIDIM